MDKKTIVGLCFKCEDCGKVFRIGPLGVEACQKRVMKHVFEESHFNLPPVNPPVGLTYMSSDGRTTVVYKGGDVKEFVKKIENKVMEIKDNMIPQLQLREVV